MHMPYTPFMRWGSHVPLLAVLAVMFIIPHDPSCMMLSPDRFGSWGLLIGSTLHGRSPRVNPNSPQQPHPLYQPPAHSMAATTVTPNAARYPAVPNLWPDQEAWRDQLQQAAAAVLPPPPPSMAQLRTAVHVRRAFRDAKGATTELLAAFSCALEVGECDDDKAHTVAFDSPAFVSAAAHWNASIVPTTVEQLRLSYGHRQNWLWGDLDACATRQLYHELLPTQLLEDERIPTHERARLAVAARRAARLYARERGTLPVALSSGLLDGMRVLIQQGTFQPDGLSEEQIWAKYARQHGLPEDALHKLVGRQRGDPSDATALGIDNDFFELVLRKSCSSNRYVDRLVGLERS